MSWAVTRQYRAARLSISLVRVIFQRTRSEELHLDEHVNCSTYRERPYEARCQAQARTRHCMGPWARIEVILWPTRSWLSRTARYRCVSILTHGAMPPATLYIWGLGPGSRNLNFSPTPRPNLNFIAVPSSNHRVLQLWSNWTWSTWLLFWSRKWPSEASNHHFFPLRGLVEGCARCGARKSSLILGAARQKRRFLTGKWVKFGISLSSPLATPMLDGLRTSDP